MPYDDETARYLRWWFTDESAAVERYAIPPARRPSDSELGQIGALRAEVENARLAVLIERGDPRSSAARAMTASETLLDATDRYADTVLGITQPRH